MPPKVQKMKLRRLKPHPQQYTYFRDLPPAKLNALADDIERNGLRHPVEVLPDRTIIAGHNRVLAAKQLGWDSIDVVVRSDLERAGTAAVEGHMIDDNMNRRQMTKLELARTYLRRREQIVEGFEDADRERRLETLDDQFKELKLEGRTLQRYLAILRTPKAVQDGFDEGSVGKINLVLAEKVAALPEESLADLARAIESGESPASAVAALLGPKDEADTSLATKKFDLLMGALGRGMAALEGRVGEIVLAGHMAEKAIAVLTTYEPFREQLLAQLRAQIFASAKRDRCLKELVERQRRQRQQRP